MTNRVGLGVCPRTHAVGLIPFRATWWEAHRRRGLPENTCCRSGFSRNPASRLNRLRSWVAGRAANLDVTFLEWRNCAWRSSMGMTWSALWAGWHGGKEPLRSDSVSDSGIFSEWLLRRVFLRRYGKRMSPHGDQKLPRRESPLGKRGSQ